MGNAFPELVKQSELIIRVIKEEEEAFLRTLDKGIKLMDNIMAKSAATKKISGVDAFTLYDTYGFPIDLSELIARENGYTIDLDAFNVELEKQKQRARNATAIEAGDWMSVGPDAVTEFVGYDTMTADVNIVRYRTVKAKNKEQIQLVFDKTPFYGEMGGEVGDSGWISSGDEKVAIINTIKENGLPIHIAERLPEDLRATFKAQVDVERRICIQNNHSATHLLHAALRHVLGTHVEQKGSFVGPESFRFDFSHYEKMSHDQINEVERLVNKLIRANAPLQEYRDVPIEEARGMGAMALFGEKYGNSVRVIKFGDSIELCGGCHAPATGAIGYFRIISESAIAAGVRRIEATTGLRAEIMVDNMEETISAIREMCNNAPDLLTAVRKTIESNESYRKAMEAVQQERAVNIKNSVKATAQEVDGITIMTLRECLSMELARNVAFLLHGETKASAFIAAFESDDNKPCLVLMYTDDLVAQGKDAGKDIREAAKAIQGGGGGQKFLATAGGKNVDGLSEATEVLLKLATGK